MRGKWASFLRIRIGPNHVDYDLHGRPTCLVNWLLLVALFYEVDVPRSSMVLALVFLYDTEPSCFKYQTKFDTPKKRRGNNAQIIWFNRLCIIQREYLSPGDPA